MASRILHTPGALRGAVMAGVAEVSLQAPSIHQDSNYMGI